MADILSGIAGSSTFGGHKGLVYESSESSEEEQVGNVTRHGFQRGHAGVVFGFEAVAFIAILDDLLAMQWSNYFWPLYTQDLGPSLLTRVPIAPYSVPFTPRER